MLWQQRLQERERAITTASTRCPSPLLSLAECAALSASLCEWQELVGDMVESAHASVDVLNALLDYDKIDTGGLALHRERLQIWALLSSAVRPFLVQAAAKKVTLLIEIAVSEERDTVREAEGEKGREAVGERAGDEMRIESKESGVEN